jgi:probable addiction module antidote protein
MNTIFIGGSRHISRLPAEVKTRIDNVITSGHHVIVGDANGADKAVQKHLLDSRYDKVTVFCSGNEARNNLGSWPIHCVDTIKNIKGFQFYAAKDRQMAHEADFGLMIWDGKSPGTILNVLRLIIAGKISVLFNVPEKAAINLKSIDQWKSFLSHCSQDFRLDLKKRATLEEWQSFSDEKQPKTLTQTNLELTKPEKSLSLEDTLIALNKALANGDTTTIMDTLGIIARARGMSQISRDTGLARESLYRSLDMDGNPEFSTVIRVLSSIGLRLEAKTKEF